MKAGSLSSLRSSDKDPGKAALCWGGGRKAQERKRDWYGPGAPVFRRKEMAGLQSNMKARIKREPDLGALFFYQLRSRPGGKNVGLGGEKSQELKR